MAIVGACKNRTPNQLPAWTSNRFVVFLERDPAGLPPNLNGIRKAANHPQGGNGGPAGKPKPGTRDPNNLTYFVGATQGLRSTLCKARQDATSSGRSCNASL